MNQKNKFTANTSPLISVILYIPEKNDDLKACIESLQRQTYKNLEIFVIDESHNQHSEILSSLCSNDSRFRLITFKESLGFFKAINAALKHCSSEYISILKGNMQISIDYYRLMINNMLENNADLVICDLAKYSDNNAYLYYNMDALRIQDLNNIEENYLEFLLKQQGNIVGYYSYCNKLYKKELLLRSFNVIDEEPFSIGNLRFIFDIFMNCNKITNIHNAFCFEKDNFIAVDKYIQISNELKKCTNIKEYLIASKIDDKSANYFICTYYLSEFFNNNCFYEQFIKSLLHKVSNLKNKEIKLFYKKILHVFNIKTTMTESFNSYESIKRFICNDKVKYFGFDIFDTLLLRPFFEPTDLFFCLNRIFNDLISSSSCIDFSIMRKEGEMACRQYYHAIRPCNEDVTLQEIYDFIAKKYGIDEDITDKLLQAELEFEYRFIQPRKIGKELFELALFSGKKVFIASDMYLPKSHIESMLDKCGYKGYFKLYVSNDVGVSKYSGSLYKYILKDLLITEDVDVGFIGDNYEVDVQRAQQNHIIGFHLPKPMELFINANQQIYTGQYFQRIFTADGGIIDLNTVLKFIGIRSMLGVVANKIFDNPFVSFNYSGDFNTDPKFIGYFICGMFLYAESKWILDKSLREKVSTVHFVSRDGYFYKKCFDMIKEKLGYNIKSNYLYLSRKVIVPLYLEKGININEVYLIPHALRQSPQSIINIMKPIIPAEILNNIENLCNKNGFPYQRTFSTMHQYYCFTKFFADKIYSSETYQQYVRKVKPFFEKQISENDVMFDVGYSGRCEKILSSLLGFPISSNYFHAHEPMALVRKNRMKFNIDMFYSFKPASAFVTREQIFTPNLPSCVGFSFDNGQCTPKFENPKCSYMGTMLVDQIQTSALMFVKDFIDIFYDQPDILTINYFDACYPLEYYLHYSKDFDRNIFAFVDFEDDFGTNQILNVKDYWDSESKNYKLDGKFTNYTDKTDIEYINQITADKQNRIDYLEATLNCMEKSWTWRIGRIFVSIPSFIKRKIFKITK